MCSEHSAVVTKAQRGLPVCPRSHRLQGFTLMELMTVVAIVGVLSAVAIPTFTNYIYKARTSEATEFLGVIRLREESYRAEFGAYCPTVAAPTQATSLQVNANLVPNPSTTRRDPKPFVSTAAWLQLGARPSGPVRFGYGVGAGGPDTWPWSDESSASDFWFRAVAVGDLDADNTYCTFEIYSPTKNIWIGGPDGKEIAKGWE